MDPAALRPTAPAAREPGQVRDGLRYVGRTPDLVVPLVMLAVVGTLAYEFSVVLPLLARNTFGGGAETYGILTSAMGAGAIVGGLIAASRSGYGLGRLSVAAAGFGGAILLAAIAPTLAVEVLALGVVGAASVTFLSTGNTTLQLSSDPRYRGRVMALWAMAFLGSTPIGGPIIGAVSEEISPRGALALGALACLAAAALGAAARARVRRATPA
jgi:MFS family permease